MKTQPATSPSQLKAEIIGLAETCGIGAIGFTTTDPFRNELQRMDELLDLYQRTGYGHRPFCNHHLRKRLIPRDHYPSARSIIVGVQPIPPGNIEDTSTADSVRGIWATNYARRGKSWYDVLEAKMDNIIELLRKKGCSANPSYVGPAHWHRLKVRPRYDILLRAAAVRAGVAQRGKNTMAYSKIYGSFIVLSAIYTDAAIPPDPPSDPESACGSCTACIDACPANALAHPYCLDAQRCLSAGTGDEVRDNREDPVPEDMRRAYGKLACGCDICQSVCPRNRNLPPEQHVLAQELDPEVQRPDLVELLESRSFRDPRWALNLGNSKHPLAIEPLARSLGNRSQPDSETAHLRLYSAWALGEIGGPQAAKVLQEELEKEQEPDVRKEIESALAKVN